MWLIVGLGNPGAKYSGTRHNIGFKVIDRMAEQYDISLEENDAYLIGRGVLEGQEALLLKPLTFMNRSGIAVKKIFKKTNTRLDRLIIIHDDLDMDVGIVKIKRNGSSGGHKGVESIIQELGTKEFIRIKIGIGRDKNLPVENYVLGNFLNTEKSIVKDAIINATEAVSVILAEGVEKAMNKYNRKTQTKRI